MITYLVAAGIVSIVSWICVFHWGKSNGYAKAKRDQKTSQKDKRRKGVIKVKELKWKKWDSMRYRHVDQISRNVVIVVQEVETIACQSQIVVVGADNTPVSVAERYLGQYWDTNKVNWDKKDKKETKPVEKMKEVLSEEEKIIKTPLKDLVKQIEKDEIELV